MAFEMPGSLLCPTCAALPIDPAAPPFGPTTYIHPFKPVWLGPLGRVRQSSCAFCRLVAYGAHEFERANRVYLSGDKDVGLWWMDDPTPPGFRLCFSGGGTSRGIVISFVHQPHEQLPPHPSHFLLPTRPPHLDLRRVRGWLDFCDNHHASCCSSQIIAKKPISSIFPGLQFLRLVDVQSMRLVTVERICRYVTLSYVWGSAFNARLTQSNRDHLSRPGSIQEAWHLMPRTIKDAIELVRGLGEKYLWIDSLCLVQNDPTDVQNGVSVMDLIYKTSILTIVAAGGHDANAGLSGIHNTRVSQQYQLPIRPNLTMAVYASLNDRLLSTSYNSRGWT